jgi:hypothetical protein
MPNPNPGTPGRPTPGSGTGAPATPGAGAPGHATPGSGTGAPGAAKPPAGAPGAPGSLGNRPSSASNSVAPATTAPVVVPAVQAPATPTPGAYADPDKNKADIENFVKLNLQNLFNDSNVDAQSKARENLIQATQPAGAPASPNFMFLYGQSLNSALSAKLAPSAKATLRQRLNVAIVTARFAYQAGAISTTIQPTTIALLKDPAEPVVFWALKAAQPQVPQALKMAAMGGKSPEIITAIRDAAFKNPSGPVFEEAYNALTGNHKIIFDELTELWQNRLVQYQTKVPQDPSADGRPAFKLTEAPMWSAVVKNNATKTKVIQMVTDQLSVAAQWADQGGPEDVHAQLVALARLCIQGLSVVATAEKAPALGTAATSALGKLDPRSFPTGAKLMPIVDPVIQQVLASFKDVKPTPAVGPAAPGGNPGANGVAGQ